MDSDKKPYEVTEKDKANIDRIVKSVGPLVTGCTKTAALEGLCRALLNTFVSCALTIEEVVAICSDLERCYTRDYPKYHEFWEKLKEEANHCELRRRAEENRK